jgi:hypothetical protein
MARDAPPRLALFVPALLEPPVPGPARDLLADLRLPALERLLGRADLEAGPQGGLEEGLFALFGCEGPAPELPVAAVTRAAESDAPAADGGWWLRADPVHLRPDLAKLVLFDAATFALSDAEARELAGAVAPLFAEAGATLRVLAPARWYLRLDAPAGLAAAPLSAVAGQDLRGHLPAGPAARRWRSLVSEVEMTLFASLVNAAREARGEPPVNSVWLWGGGRLPRVATGRWSGVHADDRTARGLAGLAGVPRRGRPASARDWLAADPGPGEHLLVDDRALRAARYGDVDGWREALTDLERSWVDPLLEALAGGRVAALGLLPGQGRAYGLARAGLRRWWRRPRALAAHLTGPG